jgi:hypothetical protein
VHASVVYDDWNVLLSRLEHAGPRDAVFEAMMWDRSRYNCKDTTLIKNVTKVYVGHTPVKDGPLELGNTVYIDQGAVFKNGSMTIVELI